MTTNPYSAPRTEETAKPRTDYALYSLNGVMIATFFGSIFAGGLVLGQNYRRLGDNQKALKVVLGTLLAGTIVLILLMQIPESVPIPNALYLLPQLLGMRAFAGHLQGEAIEMHERRGGSIASNWRALGIGLVAMVFVFAEMFAIEALAPTSS